MENTESQEKLVGHKCDNQNQSLKSYRSMFYLMGQLEGNGVAILMPYHIGSDLFSKGGSNICSIGQFDYYGYTYKHINLLFIY